MLLDERMLPSHTYMVLINHFIFEIPNAPSPPMHYFNAQHRTQLPLTNYSKGIPGRESKEKIDFVVFRGEFATPRERNHRERERVRED